MKITLNKARSSPAIYCSTSSDTRTSPSSKLPCCHMDIQCNPGSKHSQWAKLRQKMTPDTLSEKREKRLPFSPSHSFVQRASPLCPCVKAFARCYKSRMSKPIAHHHSSEGKTEMKQKQTHRPAGR